MSLAYSRILTEVLINHDSCRVHPLVVIRVRDLGKQWCVFPNILSQNYARVHLVWWSAVNENRARVPCLSFVNVSHLDPRDC